MKILLSLHYIHSLHYFQLLFKFHFLFFSFFFFFFFWSIFLPTKISKIFVEIRISVMRILFPSLYTFFTLFSTIQTTPLFLQLFFIPVRAFHFNTFSHARAKRFSRIFIVRRQRFQVSHVHKRLNILYRNDGYVIQNF